MHGLVPVADKHERRAAGNRWHPCKDCLSVLQEKQKKRGSEAIENVERHGDHGGDSCIVHDLLRAKTPVCAWYRSEGEDGAGGTAGDGGVEYVVTPTGFRQLTAGQPVDTCPSRECAGVSQGGLDDMGCDGRGAAGGRWSVDCGEDGAKGGSDGGPTRGAAHGDINAVHPRAAEQAGLGQHHGLERQPIVLGNRRGPPELLVRCRAPTIIIGTDA
jgi:hypothetical protein